MDRNTGQTNGPVSPATLGELLEKGTLDSATFVWSEQTDRWCEMRTESVSLEPGWGAGHGAELWHGRFCLLDTVPQNLWSWIQEQTAQKQASFANASMQSSANASMQNSSTDAMTRRRSQVLLLLISGCIRGLRWSLHPMITCS